MGLLNATSRSQHYSARELFTEMGKDVKSAGNAVTQDDISKIAA